MLLRRCAILYMEPREDLHLDLKALFAGTSALDSSVQWVALAPHIGRELNINAAEMMALGRIGAALWVERADCEQRHSEEVVARLLELGLLIAHGGEPDEPAQLASARDRDTALRAQHWHSLAALTHTFTRWEDVCAETGTRFPSFDLLQAEYGPPPPTTLEFGTEDHDVVLPAPADGTLDKVLLNRYTCRNFDPDASLPLALAARLLQRTFGAQEQRLMSPTATAPGALALKKTSPSGGSLHPMEAYILVQRVDGVSPGLYHYHPVRHVLQPLRTLDAEQAYKLAFDAVANQHWFANAPMLVVMAARVERNFWKYRKHAKSYRALTLDAGHLSQTFYLLATEAGVSAFITAAINEIKVEQALGLDPLKHAVIAICGCGYAAAETTMVEFRQGDLTGW
ncbi:putative peptide maturation dehydrogenase [Duganella sp. sic0402]|uniref:putative peptide maturation dehydrogenase n=1 Tax=Duganella sp. sic0402 TaxID=2854786 RepID=UPI001C4882A6|nr:putative peptide maturation dehydrogenase [Duganella sp. sic0402]MBV7534729.1 putative peptide maturation dehydrogenase [Duganella sp. sic0402]